MLFDFFLLKINNVIDNNFFNFQRYKIYDINNIYSNIIYI